jgi:hypothetical protein
MKVLSTRLLLQRVLWSFSILGLTVLPPVSAPAFPPAPHHVIYGEVRDQYGTPLMLAQAQVLLQTPTGVQFNASLVPGLSAGENYRLEIPMDSGITPDLYQSTALFPWAPFKLAVVIGQTTNLPIQMTGDFSLLGQPGQATRLDLTLGVDANGDGLPDAWELAFLSALGSNLTLADLHAGMILTPDGLTLEQQYLLGNYPFDPTNSFSLTLVAANDGAPVLQFNSITGRSYTLFGSSDLQQWVPVSFVIPVEGPSGPAHNYYYAQDIRVMQVQVMQPAAGPALQFFKMMLQ